MVIPILTYRVHGQLNLSMSIKLYFSSANSKFLLVSNYFLSLIFSITYPSRHYHSFGAEKDWLCCSAKWNVQVKQISFSILCSSHIIGWITYMDGIYVAFSIAMIYCSYQNDTVNCNRVNLAKWNCLKYDTFSTWLHFETI